MALARDLAQIAAGPLASVINALGARKVHRWTLENLDTGETLEGQFGPINPTISPGNPTYVEHTSLNRQATIMQFVSGSADSLTFGAQWFAVFEKDTTPETRIEVLRQWKNRDPNLARPPRVAFWVGDGKLALGPAVITGLGEIAYFDPPKHGGGVRGVVLPVTLKAYTAWEPTSEPAPETRYHHVKEGEYFELMAWGEYRDAQLGDVLRKRNPRLLSPAPGDIVPLPSLEAIRTEPIRPTSIPLQGILLLKDSPQKQLRQEVFDRNSGSYYTGRVPEGL
jgi:hypothetical protein